METIYITGHRNPDTDSIVSAMAYAALRNALGDGNNYVPARLGHVSDETQMVLERFGFEAPKRINNVRTQVRDLEFDRPPMLSPAVTVHRAWNVLQKDPSIPALPVVTAEGKLYGLLSMSSIAMYDMQSEDSLGVLDIPMFNLLSVLEGNILRESKSAPEKVSGEVVLGLPRAHGILPFNNPDTILICGQQIELLKEAVTAGVKTVILCQAELTEELPEGETCIISTPFDAVRVLHLISRAISIDRVCSRELPNAFHLDDYLDDVRAVVSKNRYRSYPVLDDNDCVVGMLSRYHLLQPHKKRVVLVDHNESAQSVPGLEQADLLEIIDHHRLADIETGAPIRFRLEPVGSTATIIAGMYRETGIMPVPAMAGLIASAIISDTVMFKSPTCTPRDISMAEYMARLANVSLEELGTAIFSTASGTPKPVDELLFSDFKEFHIAGHSLGIGQITCLDSLVQLERRDEFLELMTKTAKERGYDLTILMLTDVLREGTELLFIGDAEIIQQAFNTEISDNTCFLPGVMSRKKQIVPMLSMLWG
ncbi:MAG: putative manganese-dependent inorganic diphosphatase [Clostridia bacterium]|nr:putative manganese-dependent inorganic diphosphatase [Clostridia bacterium]